jgi:tRNA-specific 2-thiouridylase
MAERVVVAMSGGVDSSVAAALLCEQGYEVVGATLHLWDYPEDGAAKSRCCAPEDIHDARRVADHLGIAHFAFDRRELFQREVVQPFVDSYLQGQTPSPCVACNRGVKTKELLALAEVLGASKVATGHYARIVAGSAGLELWRARDLGKDQSYFLHMLGQDALARLLFPLGELSKSEVRQAALGRALPGALKGESQELCFVSSGRYDAFVSERAGARVRPGKIVDESGRVLGQHEGIHHFTLGQRRNLGVATGQRSYVTALDLDSGTVTLGARETLQAGGAQLHTLVLQAGVTLPLECEIAVRYRGNTVAARVDAAGSGRARVTLLQPLQAVVPGQVAVLFEGQRVLGGGVIERGLPLAGAVAPHATRSEGASA